MTPLFIAAALVCTHPGVIDGDTLRCADGTRIRVWGIQAPERYEPAGPASTRALARLITGQTLVCQRKGKSYERVVARCFIRGRDIGAAMVDGGWAVDWPRYSHGAYAR